MKPTGWSPGTRCTCASAAWPGRSSGRRRPVGQPPGQPAPPPPPPGGPARCSPAVQCSCNQNKKKVKIRETKTKFLNLADFSSILFGKFSRCYSYRFFRHEIFMLKRNLTRSQILSPWLGGYSRLWHIVLPLRLAGTTTVQQKYPPVSDYRIWAQSSLRPLIKHLETDMSRPGIEPQPSASQAATPSKS